MKNITIRLNRALSVLGGAGVLGIGLLLFGAGVVYSWIVESGAQWLAKLYAIAERERLDLPKGEYRLTSTPQDSIASYQAVFPLKGSCQQLRAFIAGVLEEIPIASWDDVRLQKQHTGDSTVDAQIRLTFFLRMR